MIVRLDKEKQRTARHQLLNDVVYIISHEALKQMQRDGHTELSPVEVFLSARNFCDSGALVLISKRLSSAFLNVWMIMSFYGLSLSK